jgi:tRNA dimethylallyltransferase
MPLSRRSAQKTERKRSKPRAAPSRPRVVAILGQSGVGKSALALKLARRFGGVIVATDAHTIYRGFNIGTAKPTRTEQRSVPHYMLDVVSPRRRYSAAEFQQTVYRLVARLQRTHPRRPIFLVGGTMLYVDVVLKGLDFLSAPPDLRLRARLQKLTDEELQARLRRLDPMTAKSIDAKNRRRLLRALEVVVSTGRPFYEARSSSTPDWDVLKIGLRMPQRQLDAQNLRRIDRMFRAGWAAEVQRLTRRYPASAPAWQAHGYREVLSYVRGERSLKKTQLLIAQKTRQNTKRQLRWIAKDSTLHWIGAGDAYKARKLVANY